MEKFSGVELLTVGDRMHQEVDLAPLLLQHCEGGVDGRGIGDVAMAEHEAADLGGERLDALLERIALIGEGELGAGRVACLGDAPGDRAVVGKAEDHPALALHQSLHQT